jgi:hypothetical protein
MSIHQWQRRNREDERYRDLPLVGSAALARAGAPLTTRSRTAIQFFLSENEEIIKIARQVAISTPTDDSEATREGSAAEMVGDRSFCPRRVLLNGLAVAALLAADERDSARSCALIQTMARLNSALDPCDMLSEGAALAGDGLMMRIAERATGVCAFQVDELLCLQDAASQAAERHTARQTILNVLSERCQGVFAAQAAILNDAQTGRDVSGLLYSLTPGWARYDAARAIAKCVDDAEGLAQAPRDALRWYRLREASAAPQDLRTPVASCTDILGVSPALERLLETVALCRAAEAGLAGMRYRTAHGQYPQALENLVPDFLEEVPEDPFNGQSLRYDWQSPAARVWSVGQNAADDRGQPPDDGETARESRDIVFHLP